MNDVDLASFISTLNAELQQFHPKWASRVEPDCKRTSAALWANGYLVRLDLTENYLEPGEPDEGSRKYDQIRMLIFRDRREPMDVATHRVERTPPLAARTWKSINRGEAVHWQEGTGVEITSQQLFSIVRGDLEKVVAEEI